MEFLQCRSEGVARTAMRTGENQKYAAPAEVLQREITATVEAWQAEIGRGRAGFQTVAFDLAAGQGPVAEAARSSRGNEAPIFFFFF